MHIYFTYIYIYIYTYLFTYNHIKGENQCKIQTFLNLQVES